MAAKTGRAFVKEKVFLFFDFQSRLRGSLWETIALIQVHCLRARLNTRAPMCLLFEVYLAPGAHRFPEGR